jgi:hypothetical protein
MAVSKKRKFRRAAWGASPATRHIVSAKTSTKARARFAIRRLGKFGAASEVRRIDPAELTD